MLFSVCFQIILLQMELITSTDVVRNLCKKMAPPLVTLLSAEPEIQYVALRNINLIVQKRPTILAHEIKVTFFELLFFDHVTVCSLTQQCIFLQVFFCKYNDPIYVKMEKLEIMIKLASDRNIDQVQNQILFACMLLLIIAHVLLKSKIILATVLV